MWFRGYRKVGLAVDGNLFGWTGLLDVPVTINNEKLIDEVSEKIGDLDK